jgi:pimeloyl-ACP methyl ester carboxylesterase
MSTSEGPEKFLASTTVGDGARTLFLVHGFLGRGRNLTTLARRLVAEAPSLRVVLPDLTGHGDSPPLPEGADVVTLATALLALAERLEVPRPLRLAGHSLGGRAALAACLVAPGAVGDVTLLDIAPGPITSSAAGSARILAVLRSAPRAAATREPFRAHLRAAGMGDAMVEWQMLNLVHEGGEYRWRIDPEALAALHPRVNAADLWPAIEPGAPSRPQSLRCIRGARSPYVSDVDRERLEAAGCPVVDVDAAHFVHVDALDAVVAAMVPSLQGP